MLGSPEDDADPLFFPMDLAEHLPLYNCLARGDTLLLGSCILFGVCLDQTHRWPKKAPKVGNVTEDQEQQSYLGKNYRENI